MGGGQERAADARGALEKRRRELLTPTIVRKRRVVQAIGHEELVMHELRKAFAGHPLDHLGEQRIPGVRIAEGLARRAVDQLVAGDHVDQLVQREGVCRSPGVLDPVDVAHAGVGRIDRRRDVLVADVENAGAVAQQLPDRDPVLVGNRVARRGRQVRP
ncbi:MAG: hypothetical protein WCZ20_06235, partial [Hydrogenophaga sp.]